MNTLKSGVDPDHKECEIIFRVLCRSSGGNSQIKEKNACNRKLFDFL